MSLNTDDFEFIKRLLLQNTGIDLDDNKENLVISRLTPIAHHYGVNTVQALLHKLRRGFNDNLHSQVLEALTTKETQFFREKHVYQAFQESILPELMKRREPSNEINLWSAACSTGQEPYSVAILLAENFNVVNGWDVRLIASDISEQVLARAKTAIYNDIEIERGLPEGLRAKYFEKHETKWRLKTNIRNQVEFRRINIVDVWPLLPKMDVIFLRNTLIYFSDGHKHQVFERIQRLLKPGGFLIMGTGENSNYSEYGLEAVKFGRVEVYRRLD